MKTIKLSAAAMRAMSDTELRAFVYELQGRTLQSLARQGGLARAAALTAAERSAIASKAGKAGGWPKGRKRGTR